MKSIDVGALHERMNREEDAWPHRRWALFDVREAGESQKGHIPSATFLPRRMLEFRLPEIVSAPMTSIVLYDTGDVDDGRAVRASGTMSAHGFGDVAILAGGMSAWRAAGHDVATGWNVPSKIFGEQVLVGSDTPYLTADELAERLDAGQNIGVYDVRTPEEYREGSLPASLAAPSFEWTLSAKDMIGRHDAVVLHCAGRTRSIIAAATARLLGMDNIYSLENGTMGWRLANRDLTSGREARIPTASAASIVYAVERARSLALGAGVELVSADDLFAMFVERESAQLAIFDTRREDEYRASHIPHSVWLPGGQACQRADDFAAVPGSPVVFVDDGDARAMIAAYWFKRMGFPRIFTLDGGVPAWRKKDFPVATGRGRPQPLGLDEAMAATPALSASDVVAAMNANPPPVIVDVGIGKHFSANHLAGANWVPRAMLESRIAAVAGPEARVIVAAREKSQAALAAATLAKLGYRRVSHVALDGRDWSKTKLPLETGMPEDAPPISDSLAIPYRETKERMLAYLEWEEKLGHRFKAGGDTEAPNKP